MLLQSGQVSDRHVDYCTLVPKIEGIDGEMASRDCDVLRTSNNYFWLDTQEDISRHSNPLI
jgi:hypothetical protein